MSEPRFLIGSGFHATAGDGRLEFSKLWYRNTVKYGGNPCKIMVMSTGSSTFHFPCDVIDLSGNLGHFMELVHGQKPHSFNGWSGSMLALALIAYNDEADFIYKEADALWFGDCIGKMYEEIGTAGGIWGNCSFMACEQSLFLIKHAQIPEFVRQFLDGPPQNTEQELGEQKFLRMERQHPGQYKRFSFGVGRDRPIHWEDPVWYAQKLTAEELKEATRRQLI